MKSLQKICVMLFLVGSIALGDEGFLPIKDVVIIHSGNRYRILLQIDTDSLPPLDPAFAGLPIPWTPQQLVTLHVYPITTPWDPTSVTWTFPWQNPGGDFHEDVHAFYTFGSPPQDTQEIDLTPIFRYWNTSPNYGMIIIPESLVGTQFPPSMFQFLSQLLQESSVHWINER